MSSRYCSGKAMSSSSFGFCETPMPSVSFCLPTPFDCLYLFTYRSRPVQTNKKIDDFFFACGCRAGILFDFQMIIERGPEIFTGEPGEIDEDGWHYPITDGFRNRGYFQQRLPFLHTELKYPRFRDRALIG